ncbi:hypothetical protein [Streptomyces sp. SID7909]|uniref:hypothetical protein n=1 Tax=Streptomyces sp. SID7909 TaxID=2706092 RepID=UPI001940D5B1|nr:hypothetical protein [Streptomyces sp. SID7909]
MLRFPGNDEWFFEATGYLQNWSVQAAREAIAAGADLLLPLLGGPDPAVRIATAYALAAASAVRIYALLWPGKEDRTRSLSDAVLGVP